MKSYIVYRNAVGQRTHEIVTSLTTDDMKRKISMQGLGLIKQEGGVTNHERSNKRSNKIFTEKDIFNFCKATAVNMLIVVGNKGSIYLLRKKEQFDKYKLIEYYSRETDKNKNKFLRNIIIEQTLKVYQDEIGIAFLK